MATTITLARNPPINGSRNKSITARARLRRKDATKEFVLPDVRQWGLASLDMDYEGDT